MQVFRALKKEKEPKKQVVKFFTVKIRGLGFNHKKKDLKQFFKPLIPKSIRVPQKIKGIAYVGFKTEKHMKQALSKHKSFLGEEFQINVILLTILILVKLSLSTSYLNFLLNRWKTNIRSEIRTKGE